MTFLKKTKQLLSCLLILVCFIQTPFTVTAGLAAGQSRQHNLKSGFSDKVDTAFAKSAKALDVCLLRLADSLNQKGLLSVKVHSHFYDQRIRRYFISISGAGCFQGRLPFELDADEYLISCEKEITYDITFSEIKKNSKGISFKYEGCIVFSMDLIAYELMKAVPHIAASGALNPAARLLTEFLERFNVGIMSEAISETLKKFSSIAISRTGADLLSAAGKNKELGTIIKAAVKDGTILSFIGLSILKCASTSLLNLAGASFGSTV
ncbi:MAG: hypothetical protein Kow0029_31080 [Candidatus Rifleibacteriota bacterium]